MKTKNDIISVLKDFYNVSGFRISVYDTDFKEIYCYPKDISPFCRSLQQSETYRSNCIKCDRTAFDTVKKTEDPYVYKCDCGLYEAVAPIYNYGVLSGYLMMGQVRDESEENKHYILNCARPLFETESELLSIFSLIRKVPSNMIKSYITLMTVIAEYFTQQATLSSSKQTLAELICMYLNRNYSKKITLEDLSKKFGRCKSTIMNSFKSAYDVTVIDFLNNIRLENAEKLIKETEYSFKEIAYHCGFYDQNYFSRLFSQKFKMSPSDFRKYIKNQNKSIAI